jgi:Holliday junction resolvase RusA-like endonuclease
VKRSREEIKMQLEFWINGKPRGKERPRFSRGHTYTPQRTRNYETTVITTFLRNFRKDGTKFPIFEAEKQVSVELIAYYEIPKSWSRKKRAEALAGRLRPTVKPDTDNIAKIILDSLNGLAYHDDKQVIECRVSKWYGDVAGVSVKVKEA